MRSDIVALLVFIELHIPTDRFLAGLRGRFKRQLVFPMADPITSQGLPSSLFGGCGRDELWLDRIEVWDTTLVDYDGAGIITLRQPFNLLVVSRTALNQNGAASSPPCWMGTITAVFRVEAHVEAGVPTMCVEFVRFESDDIPDPIIQLFNDAMDGMFRCEAIDLGGVNALFGQHAPEIRRVGLALSVDRDRLGLNIMFESVGAGLAQPGPAEQGLQDGFDLVFDEFLGGRFTGDTPDEPWSMILHSLLLQVAARRRARRGLEEEDRLRILSAPSAAFKIDSNGVPRIEITFSVDAIDACPWTDGDIGVDVVSTASYTSPEPGQIVAHLQFEYDLYPGDVALCAGLSLAAGPLWILDQIMRETESGEALLLTVLVLGNIGLAVTFPYLVAMLASPMATSEIEDELNPEEDETDPEALWVRIRGNDDELEFRRISAFELNAGPLGVMALTNLVGRNDNQARGMLLSGTMTDVAEPASPGLDLGGQDAFSVLFDDPCGDEPRLTAFYTVYPMYLNGAVLAEGGIRILDGTDPLDQYRPFLVVDSIRIQIAIPIDRIQTAYAEAPYAPQLLIATTGGVRILTLPQLPILTDEEIAELTEANEQTAPLRCDDWAISHDFWKGSRFNPRWHVDPPPDEIVAVGWAQYWEVMVAGLAAGDPVTFEDHEGNTLAMVTAERGGRLAWQGVLPSDTAVPDAGLSMYRGEIPPPDDTSVTRTTEPRRNDERIAIRQMMLLEQARIRVPGGLRGLALLPTDYGPQLAVADPDGVSVYSVPSVERPMRVGRWRLPRTFGVLGWEDGWVAWGRYGLAGPSGAVVECGHAEGVRALVPVEGTLLALTPLGLYQVDRKLRLQDLVVAASARHMAVGRTTLALTDGDGVTFHRRRGLHVGEAIATVSLPPRTTLTYDGMGDRYCLRGHDGARTVLDPDGRVRRKDPPTGQAATREVVARWRDHLAVATVGGSAITIYRTGPARLLRR